MKNSLQQKKAPRGLERVKKMPGIGWEKNEPPLLPLSCLPTVGAAMDSRGRGFLVRNAHLIETEKILQEPFYRLDTESRFECLQEKNSFDQGNSEILKVCEEPPFRSFQRLLEHLHNDHQMCPQQLEWSCHPCARLFTSEAELAEHRLLCQEACEVDPRANQKVATLMLRFTSKASRSCMFVGSVKKS